MGLFSYVDNKGYKRRKSDGKPIHRIIAEILNGGPLKKGAVVHHKNRNKRDNSPGNLRIFKNQGLHNLLHKWTAFWFGKNASYKGGKKELGIGFVLLAVVGMLCVFLCPKKKQAIPNTVQDVKSNEPQNENI